MILVSNQVLQLYDFQHFYPPYFSFNIIHNKISFYDTLGILLNISIKL